MRPARIVLDSNVIISAFLFGGPPARVIEYILAGSVRCFVSVPILDEVRDVLRRPKFGLSSDQALTLSEELHDLCQMVTPLTAVRDVHADPDDNAVLECALASNADTIVSGDAHLLDLGVWRGIRILSPAQFIREITGPLSGSA